MDTEKDVFDEIVDGEEISDDPIMDEIVSEDVGDESDSENKEGEEKSLPPNETKESEESTEPTLEDRLSGLEKANTGLLSALKSERTQRQELQEMMKQISETFKNAKSQDDVQITEEQIESLDIPIDYREDGNAFVSQDALEKFIASKIDALKSEITEVKETTTQRRQVEEQSRQFENTVNSIVSEKEEFKSAKSVLDNALSWISKEIIAEQELTGEMTVLTPAEALDFIDKTGLDSKFEKDFPGVDIDRVVRAYDSKRDLKTALRTIAASASKKEDVKNDPKPTKMDTSLKRIANKPSNFSDVRNQKDVNQLSLDDIGSLTPEQILSLPDNEVNKIMSILQKSER